MIALAPSAPAVVGAAGGLTRLFDVAGYSRVAGAAVLLPRGTSSPEAVREVVAAGARAVLVDGPLPAGSLGTDGPADVPILGLLSADANVGPRILRRAIPVAFAVGAAAFDTNDGARRSGAVLVRRARLRRRPQAGGERGGHRARHLGPGPERGRRGAVRDPQRLERGRRADGRCGRPAG